MRRWDQRPLLRPRRRFARPPSVRAAVRTTQEQVGRSCPRGCRRLARSAQCVPGRDFHAGDICGAVHHAIKEVPDVHGQPLQGVAISPEPVTQQVATPHEPAEPSVPVLKPPKQVVEVCPLVRLQHCRSFRNEPRPGCGGRVVSIGGADDVLAAALELPTEKVLPSCSVMTTVAVPPGNPRSGSSTSLRYLCVVHRATKIVETMRPRACPAALAARRSKSFISGVLRLGAAGAVAPGNDGGRCNAAGVSPSGRWIWSSWALEATGDPPLGASPPRRRCRTCTIIAYPWRQRKGPAAGKHCRA